MAHIFTGDTVRIRTTFNDFPSPSGAEGPLIDPDANDADINIYNGELRLISTDNAVRESLGVYIYDWTVPEQPGTYYVEVKGLFNGKVQINRKKYSVKFKPHTV